MQQPQTQQQAGQGGQGADEPVEGQARPVPDEDGPHDVPDDKVIEKTLPTPPSRDSGRAA